MDPLTASISLIRDPEIVDAEVYAKFGVLVSRKGLSQSEKTSTTAVRLALSVLELLLTKEECQTLSVYGRNKHKTCSHGRKKDVL